VVAALAFLAACVWFAGRRGGFASSLHMTALGTIAWMLAFGAGLFNATWPEEDVRPISTEVGTLAATGMALGHAGSYEGEFHFYPRLETEIVELHGQLILRWVQAHPDGALIAVYPGSLVIDGMSAEPLYRQLFRGDVLMVWRNSDIVAHPELLDHAHD